MIGRIKSLETISRRLEPSASERAELHSQVLAYANDFLDRIYSIPAFVRSEEKGVGIYDSPLSEDPADIAALLKILKEQVDTPGLNPASGGHLGYIPGGGIFPAALGDYLADVTNRYAGIFFASPGAVRMENMLIAWMASIVGYPTDAAGNLTSGGSIANLMGIVTAREALQIKAKDIERSAIYLTEHAHHSVDKAIRIAGLRESIIRYVPMDARSRMDAEALERLVAEDAGKGVHPWLIIASAGTTDVGAVDPLTAIGDIARRHHCWYHIDGAYGAFFVLCEEGRKILEGIGTSDSLVMDPHKGLFLPYGSGAVLVRERKKLQNAHYYVANYMQDTIHSREELSPADLSPELTKHFRGLRLWLSLKLAGVAPFRAGLEEKILLARYFYDRLREMPGFEVGPYPELSVVIFRYIPEKGDVTAFNERLVQEIHNDGRVFMSSSLIGGKFMIRLAVLAFRTHLETIDLALTVLSEKVKKLQAE